MNTARVVPLVLVVCATACDASTDTAGAGGSTASGSVSSAAMTTSSSSDAATTSTTSAAGSTSTGGPGADYTTNFDATENPIDEGGHWPQQGGLSGLDWTNVQTANGIAFGTQTGNDGYDDSIALLSGFGPNRLCQPEAAKRRRMA